MAEDEEVVLAEVGEVALVGDEEVTLAGELVGLCSDVPVPMCPFGPVELPGGTEPPPDGA